VGRHGEPWKRKGRGYWITLDGRKVQLVPEGATKAEARKALEAIRAGGVPSDGVTTWEAVDRFLLAQEGRLARGEINPRRMKDLEWFLSSFGAFAKDVPLADLRKHHLVGWLDKNKAWGQSTRRLGAKIVKMAYDWARDVGHVDCPDALAKLKMPRIKRRDVVADAAAVEQMKSARDDPGWRNLIDFLDKTACRPSEACNLDAAHVDFAEKVAWVVDKNRRKTGKQRRPVYFGAAVEAILREQVAKHPEGPVFRNSRGTGWTDTTIRHVLRRAGVKWFPYSLRHGRITDMVEKLGILKASQLAGHNDLAMTLSYSHAKADADALRHAAELAQGSVSPSPPPAEALPSASSAPPDADPDRPARRPRRK
jgi:integrase